MHTRRVIKRCSVPGCDRTGKIVHGLCRMHETRLRRHGDVNTVKPSLGAGSGPENPRWRGEDISYRTAHDRVVRQWGRASEHNCVDCGDQATHWSYDGTDPNELSRPGRVNKDGSVSVQRWSADLSHYSSRCYRCHVKFDETGRRRQSRERAQERHRKVRESAGSASQSESGPQ